MGTILYADRRTDTQYQHVRVYEDHSSPGFSGWGVRTRTTLSTAEAVLCTKYPIPYGTRLARACFMFSAVGAAPVMSIAVWRYSTTDPATIYRVSSFNITAADVDGGVFLPDVKYVVEFDPISIGSGSIPLGTEFYISFYADDCRIYADDSVDDAGALIYTDATNINDPLVIINSRHYSDFTAETVACSFEAWGEVAAWDRVLPGGTVAEVNEDWHDTSFIVTDGWTNKDNIMVDDANFADATEDDSVWIDLGAGLDPAVPWDESALPEDFPDYDVYGVRALKSVHIEGRLMAADSELTISWTAADTTDAPDIMAGWENIATIIPTGATPEGVNITYACPHIARWIKITKQGTTSDEVQFVSVTQIQYPVTDGEFMVDHSDDPHYLWVDNYPSEDKVYKMSLANSAGAESETTNEYTNRINRD